MSTLTIELDCKCEVEVEFDYHPATNRVITSRSLEPNDPEELDIYSVKLKRADLPAHDDEWLREQVLEVVHKLLARRE